MDRCTPSGNLRHPRDGQAAASRRQYASWIWAIAGYKYAPANDQIREDALVGRRARRLPALPYRSRSRTRGLSLNRSHLCNRQMSNKTGEFYVKKSVAASLDMPDMGRALCKN